MPRLARISFIIASRDEPPENLHATIKGLQASTAGWWREIIVVDDGSQTPITYHDPEVTIVRNPAPVGVCPSRRRGCALATGDVLTVMDPHMSFGPGWLDEMASYVDSGSLLCSPWREYCRSVTISYGADFAWREASADFGFGYRPRPPRRRLVTVPMVIGACYMISRRSYERLGGFCPLLGVWGLDEQDLSMRAWLAGLQVHCVTRAQVGHLSSIGRKEPWRMAPGQWVTNNLVVIRSNLEAETVKLYEPFHEPLLPEVADRLAQLDLDSWRDRVQSVRRMSDREFFGRFGHALPRPGPRGRLVPGFRFPGLARAEEDEVRARLSRPEGRSACPGGRFSFGCFGLGIEVQGPPDLLEVLTLECPPGTPSDEVQHRYGVTSSRHGLVLTLDGRWVAWARDQSALARAFAKSLHRLYAHKAQALFLGAAVLEVEGWLLLLSSGPHRGTWSLVAELIEAGAGLVSDRYLVLDHAGVHPFVVPSSGLKLENPEPRRSRAILVADTELRPDGRWRPRVDSGGVLQAWLGASRLPQTRLPEAFKLVGRLCRRAQFLRSPRGDAGLAARALVSRCRRLIAEQGPER